MTPEEKAKLLLDRAGRRLSGPAMDALERITTRAEATPGMAYHEAVAEIDDEISALKDDITALEDKKAKLQSGEITPKSLIQAERDDATLARLETEFAEYLK